MLLGGGPSHPRGVLQSSGMRGAVRGARYTALYSPVWYLTPQDLERLHHCELTLFLDFTSFREFKPLP